MWIFGTGIRLNIWFGTVNICYLCELRVQCPVELFPRNRKFLCLREKRGCKTQENGHLKGPENSQSYKIRKALPKRYQNSSNCLRKEMLFIDAPCKCVRQETPVSHLFLRHHPWYISLSKIQLPLSPHMILWVALVNSLSKNFCNPVISALPNRNRHLLIFPWENSYNICKLSEIYFLHFKRGIFISTLYLHSRT